MSHIIGLVLLLTWSLGLLVPYTIIGFIEILLITAILNSLLKKIMVKTSDVLHSGKGEIEFGDDRFNSPVQEGTDD